jgi:hypothetical protein
LDVAPTQSKTISKPLVSNVAHEVATTMQPTKLESCSGSISAWYCLEIYIVLRDTRVLVHHYCGSIDV